MIQYKSRDEIEIMKAGGKKLKLVVSKLIPFVQAGMSTNEVDKEAERLLRAENVEPSFQRVSGYHWSTCLTVNDQVVHTPPSDRVLKNGDVLTIDIGAFYKGFNTDFATTFVIGNKAGDGVRSFLKLGEETLHKAIQQARVGNRIGHISQVIEHEITMGGCFIMKQLTGHGVGRELHEDPFIPGYLSKPLEKTQQIREGLVAAIEVIYSKGTEEVMPERGNSWSLVTQDGSLSACFEHTVAILDKMTIILT